MPTEIRDGGRTGRSRIVDRRQKGSRVQDAFITRFDDCGTVTQSVRSDLTQTAGASLTH